jgi:hypothetical protein
MEFCSEAFTTDVVRARARDVFGDALKEVIFKDRIRRSERITLHFTSGFTLSLTADSYRDPHTVRKALLKFLQDYEVTRGTIG